MFLTVHVSLLLLLQKAHAGPSQLYDISRPVYNEGPDKAKSGSFVGLAAVNF